MHLKTENLIDEYANLPLNIYSSDSVREMDRFAIEECGVDGFELMNKAARFSFHSLLKAWPNSKNLIILCGSGNNAGDGYIVAALAQKRSLNVHILFASSPEKLCGDAKLAYKMSRGENVPCSSFEQKEFERLCKRENTVIVDALFGTGLNNEVKGKYADIINAANNQSLPIIAIDIPSGLSANTGQAFGVSICADITATFIGLKLGLFIGAGRTYSGKIVFSALDLPSEMFQHIPVLSQRLDISSLLQQLPSRKHDTHKGQCGHVMILGGDIGYGGAIILAASAAARMGSGLISVITQDAHRTAILSHLPEAMVHCSQNAQDIEQRLNMADVIVIGPGLGKSAWSQKLLLSALASQKPLVIDADALNLLSEHQSQLIDLTNFKTNNHVFTPHPGEAARLLNTDTHTIQSDRVASLTPLKEKWGGNFLLKGSGSLILTNCNKISLSPYGNSGMATGGMGDVLSGLIGGLIAQGLSASYALQLAVCLHAKAADILVNEYGERGLLASDLIPITRKLLNSWIS